MAKEAVILAGGFGTRLKTVVDEIPKPMAPIGSMPFLAYLLRQLQKHRIAKVVLATGYKHDIIESYFGSSYMNIELAHSVEKEALGTGGAIRKACGLVESDHCFILNGDTFFEADFERMEEKFLLTNSWLTVALKPMVNFDRYGAVITRGEKIISFNEKRFCKTGLINGGIYVVNKKWFMEAADREVFSLERDILEQLAGNDKITYCISDGYFIDIGIPEDYLRASEELPRLFD